MSKKTFDEVKVGDKVRYYDPTIKANKELETKDHKGGEYEAVVIGLRVAGGGMAAEKVMEVSDEFEGMVDLVYNDTKWLPETNPTIFRPVMEYKEKKLPDGRVISQPSLVKNELIELPMPEPGRHIEVTGVPFRGRVGSKTRAWDFE